MQIASDAPNEREQLGYSFKRQLLFRESSMRLPGHQDPDELAIRKSALRQGYFFRALNDLENLRLWRLRQDRLQSIEAPIAAVDVDRVTSGESFESNSPCSTN